VRGKLKKIYRKILPPREDPVVKYLQQEIKKGKTLLDIGCGKCSQVKYLQSNYSIGVDIFRNYVYESKRKKIHSQYIIGDIRELNFKPKSIDVVIAIEVIEHLEKHDGYTLLQKMENWAKEKIIISTPNGVWVQDEYDNNPYQKHKSVWQVKDLEKLGFKVYGVDEFKLVRKFYRRIKFQFIRRRIVDISWKLSPLTYKLPKRAFRLLGVKEL